jgi:hypothetical protein
MMRLRLKKDMTT